MSQVLDSVFAETRFSIKRKIFAWNDEQTEKFKGLLVNEAKLSATDIGKKMGITRNAVIGKAARLGLPLPNQGNHNRHKGPPNPLGAKPERRVFKHDNRPTPKALARAFLATEQAEAEDRRSKSAVTQAQLEWFHCRWPLGDPTTPEFRYCGDRKLGPLSYCRYHCRIAFQPARPAPQPFIPFRKDAR